MMALIALVILTISGLALLRTVDTGLVISGNLAFKQSTANAGDVGTETAIAWLTANASGSILQTSSPANGYYANWMQSCDLTGNMTPEDTHDDVDWDGGNQGNESCNAQAAAIPTDRLINGYSGSYIIHRLCSQDGDPGATGNTCNSFIDESQSAAGSTKSGASYGTLPISSSAQHYYRITTRITGPRNSVSHVQAVVLL